jgi:tRNA (guanine-N7-)-methyltransferase
MVRNRQHVNVHGISFHEFRGEMPRLTDGRVVELEIGCADAQFLFERAEQDPNRTYIGLEIREPQVDWVNRKARKLGAPVQAVFCHASLHLESLLPRQSVQHCYLNFPDPWFKRKHHSRRMINDDLVRQIHEVLHPTGDVLMQSDVFEVALDAMDVFERRDELFANMLAPWSFWKDGNPFGVRSWREMNCEEEGMPVWRIRYRPLQQPQA